MRIGSGSVSLWHPPNENPAKDLGKKGWERRKKKGRMQEMKTKKGLMQQIQSRKDALPIKKQREQGCDNGHGAFEAAMCRLFAVIWRRCLAARLERLP